MDHRCAYCDSHAYGDSNSYIHAYAYSYPHAYANGNRYFHLNSDTCVESYSYTTGAPESATATVVVNDNGRARPPRAP
jgi:hypothetical protein